MSTIAPTASQDILSNLASKVETKKTTVEDSQSRFLKLLTTQLQNQDPLNPVDNAQTTSQLAQISTVDGIERLNATMSQLVGSFQSNETLQAAALVGRQVMVQGSGMDLYQGMGIGGLTLEGPADSVAVSIRDANGLEVATMSLDGMAAGSHTLVWDGKAINGSAAADGKYTISMTATQGGKAVGVQALQMATVTNVVTGGKTVEIDVGKMGRMTLSDVRLIL